MPFRFPTFSSGATLEWSVHGPHSFPCPCEAARAASLPPLQPSRVCDRQIMFGDAPSEIGGMVAEAGQEKIGQSDEREDVFVLGNGWRR